MSGLPVPAAAKRIAFTIDDLPVVAERADTSDRQKAAIVGKVLRALRRHRVTGVGFAIGVQVASPADGALLDRFIAGGHLIGNHTYSHRPLTSQTASEFAAEVANGETALRRWLSPERLFRHPLLRTGETARKQALARAALRRQRYLTFPVTVDNDDWRFNRRYENATSAVDAAAIGARYLTHMMSRLRHFERLSWRKVGRAVSHILLAHMNALNADYLDDLLRIAKADGWSFIHPLEAIADPVYRMKTSYLGERGVSWLLQIAPR